jgi:hypothetical protein
MEKWYAYEKIQVQVEHIYGVFGGGRECTIFFSDKENRKYVLHSRIVFDFRYTIKTAFCNRVAKRLGQDSVAGIYTVEDSDYLKFFEDHTSGTIPIPWLDDLRHFILFDAVNTGIELLVDNGSLVLTEIGDAERGIQRMAAEF